jgi:hypothetical protein
MHETAYNFWDSVPSLVVNFFYLFCLSFFIFISFFPHFIQLFYLFLHSYFVLLLYCVSTCFTLNNTVLLLSSPCCTPCYFYFPYFLLYFMLPLLSSSCFTLCYIYFFLALHSILFLLSSPFSTSWVLVYCFLIASLLYFLFFFALFRVMLFNLFHFQMSRSRKIFPSRSRV